jgi:RNA polymerase sigma-70 factor, ECF subfamily
MNGFAAPLTMPELVPQQAEEQAEGLIARLRAGDAAALARAYDLHHAHVRAFARRLVGDADVAEDLVHEAFVALPKAMRRFAGESSLRTFLVAIAVNQARHFVRAAARRRAAVERMAREPAAAGASPEHLVQRRELCDALHAALDRLPVDQRVAFVLCEVEERTSVEAAGLAGVPEGTMRTRLFHARRRLRELLEGQR